jgi:formylglycine-generating enzyme required for sulfatase activity
LSNKSNIDEPNVTLVSNATGYRLPTEAEWEYAAKGGNPGESYEYSGSDIVDEVAWYRENRGRTSHEVGMKVANGPGLYDMSGNVFEWCWDWYKIDYYNESPVSNLTGRSSGATRVACGGRWYDGAANVGSANRRYGKPSFRNGNLGFRLVRWCQALLTWGARSPLDPHPQEP